jgi:hypothetical protein
MSQRQNMGVDLRQVLQNKLKDQFPVGSILVPMVIIEKTYPIYNFKKSLILKETE